jgi:hypothetical protein
MVTQDRIIDFAWVYFFYFSEYINCQIKLSTNFNDKVKSFDNFIKFTNEEFELIKNNASYSYLIFILNEDENYDDNNNKKEDVETFLLNTVKEEFENVVIKDDNFPKSETKEDKKFKNLIQIQLNQHRKDAQECDTEHACSIGEVARKGKPC